MNDGAGDAETLLHAADSFRRRSRLWIRGRHGLWLRERGQESGRDPACRRGRNDRRTPNFEIAVDGEEIGEVADVLLRFARVKCDIDLIDGDLAGGGSEEPTEHFESGALPAPLGPMRPKISPAGTSRKGGPRRREGFVECRAGRTPW